MSTNFSVKNTSCFPHCHDYLLPIMVKLFEAQDNAPDVLFLGDSVLERVSDFDEDKTPLNEQVARSLLPELKTNTLSHTAFNCSVFKKIAAFISTSEYKPGCLIISINLRSFSPQWYAYPEYQYVSLKNLFDQYAKADHARRLKLLKLIPKQDKHLPNFSSAMNNYKSLEQDFFFTKIRKMDDFLKIKALKPVESEQQSKRRRLIYILHYAYKLSIQHPLLSSLDILLRAIKESGVCVVFYITPINYKSAVEHVGREFLSVIDNNKKIISDMIHSRLPSDRYVLDDLSTLLGKEAFFQPHIANEHLNEHGRAILCKVLVHSIYNFL